MLARKSLSKKRFAILGGAMAGIWIIIGVVVYRTFLHKPASVPPPTALVPVTLEPGPVTTPAAQPTNLPVDLLTQPSFTSLKVYSDIPLQAGTLGRENPFEPISVAAGAAR